MNNSANNANQ
jgi:hypothetical protein